MTSRLLGLALATIGLCIAGPVHAAMAVIDVSAIRQLVQQVTTLRQQLTVARDQLHEAQQLYASTTGGRGMERLLAGETRNYLPPDWRAMADVLDGRSASYGALATDLQALMRDAAVLGPGEVARLPVSLQARIDAARRSAGLDRLLARQALEATSGRFARLDGLIAAIGTASDPKAVMDLQARIQAEQAMLVNEQTKLAVLFQAAAAERQALELQARERAVRDLGSLRRLPAMGL
jgi:type IV secretion system protein VirB5